MLVLVRLGEKRLETAKRLREQRSLHAERFRRQPRQSDGALGAGAETHLAARAIVQINLAVGRLKSRAQSRHAAALALQARERELDMLAGSQGVRGEIRT